MYAASTPDETARRSLAWARCCRREFGHEGEEGGRRRTECEDGPRTKAWAAEADADAETDARCASLIQGVSGRALQCSTPGHSSVLQWNALALGWTPTPPEDHCKPDL